MSDTDKLADALKLIERMRDAIKNLDHHGVYAHELRDADASLAAPPAQGEWVTVPRVPTPEMDAAGKQALSDNGIGDLVDSDALVCYAAMLAAAPQPAPAPVQADETVSRP